MDGLIGCVPNSTQVIMSSAASDRGAPLSAP